MALTVKHNTLTTESGSTPPIGAAQWDEAHEIIGTVSLATEVAGTLPIANGGTNAITAAAALASLGAYPSANPNGYTSNVGTVTSVSGTAPVVSSGGATPAISIAAATTSVNGYLTSTDWNTFNGKQATLVSGTNIKTVGGLSLLGSGDVGTITAGFGGTGQSSYTVGDILFASAATTLSKLADVATGNAIISGGIGVAPSYGKIGLTTHISGTLPVTNGGTGATTLTSNFLVKGNGTSAVSASVVYDGGTNVGIGTSFPSQKLSVAGTVESITGGFKFPDGTTQTTASSGSGVSYPQNIQSGNYTLVLADAGKHIYSANTGAQTITIPTNALVAFPIGSVITIVNMGTTKITMSTTGVSIIPNGSTTALSSAQIPSGASVQLLKTGTNTWNALFGVIAANAYTAQYLVIAGGGSGGGNNGGGGGAGGYLTSTTSFSSGSIYTVTVGAGGAGVTATAQGIDGSDSSLIGSGVSVTSTKGGGGGSQNGANTGRSGGSGGGGAYLSGSGGTGTVGQGNNGGLGASASGNGGGGGGASASGIGADAGSSPCKGGDGIASSITGTSVTRAGGGGGGGSDRFGAGGSGGGGAGGQLSASINGTANTGGGGGGGRTNTGTSGAGGSGVVLLSIPTAEYSGITTGSPVVTVSGANTILQFNSSGTYTA